MSASIFKGSMPEFYDHYLGPVQFVPYAYEISKRVALVRPEKILETACGTGLVTKAIRDLLPDTTLLIATDFSQDMLDWAAAKLSDMNVLWRKADAQSLPFSNSEFDVVVCQFGVMFFPDRIAAYRECRRVLNKNGVFIFNVWDSLEENELPNLVVATLASIYSDDPPTYNRLVPYGYNDPENISAELKLAGFRNVDIEFVNTQLSVPSAESYAIGSCQGGTNRVDIEKRDPYGLELATNTVARALEAKYGKGEFEVRSRAIFIQAR